MQDLIILKCAKESCEPSQIIIGSVKENLEKLLRERKVVVVTDAKTHASNRDFIDSFDHIIIGQGESSKILHTLEGVYRRLLETGADRSSFLLGVGGGIVTDITGFAASTYMRGITFGFIPTTLLAQVDASIGGKNGVNLDGYKNIIGLFNQPEFVICDTELLSSLSDKDFRAGLAEVIKAGIIGDPELFSLLERHTFDEIRQNKELLEEIVGRAVRVKTAIVESDEKESGERRKLNLGHTFAHAMEKNAPLFSHGEAVAAGVVAAAELAVKTGVLGVAEAERIKAVIKKHELPVVFPVDAKSLISFVKFDKKREREHINIILPTSIGNCKIVKMTFPEFEALFV